MKNISGTYCCNCNNQFEWKTFFIQSGEAVFGCWDDIQKNVVRKDITNNQYHITIRCPKCNRSYFITKDKEE